MVKWNLTSSDEGAEWSAGGWHAMRVLIVDDDLLLGRALAKYMVCHGIDAHHEAGSLRAITRVISDPYDMLVLDAISQNPRYDCVRLLREMRGRGRATPVVVMANLLDKARIASLHEFRVEIINKFEIPAALMAKLKHTWRVATIPPVNAQPR